MILMLEDSINSKTVNDREYSDYINCLKKYDRAKLLEIFLKGKERSNYPINRTLLFDQMAFSIIS